MRSIITSMSFGRRFTVAAVALVLIAATIGPLCVNTCCAMSANAARMMAFMPCCAAGAAKLKARADAPATPDATLARQTIAPSDDAQPAAVTSTAALPAQRVALADGGPTPDSAGDPPPLFLRNAQFRI